MKKSLLAILISAAITACSPAPESVTSVTAESATASPQTTKDSESVRLHQWFESKYEEQLQQSPLQMTFLGRKDKYDQLDDFSVEAQQKQLQWYAATVEELKTQFDYSKLNDEDQISYDIWVYQYKVLQENEKFRKHAYVFDHMQGSHAFFPQLLLNFHKVDNLSDMQAYIARIEHISRGIQQLLTQVQDNAAGGVRAPRFAYEGIIEQIDNLTTGAPFTTEQDDIPLWADVKSKIATLKEQDLISDQQATELQASAEAALKNHFLPSYTSLKAWFVADLPNTDEQAAGAWKLPDGEAFYNHQLRVSTTTDMTADEIHQLGLKEVERLTAEMQIIKDKVGFDGSLHEFFDFIRTDAQFFYPDTDAGRQAYLDDSTRYLDFIKHKLPEYFGILPKADLIVKRVEAFREQPGAAQHYFPGTPDGARPGIYYAHLSDMKSMPKNEMEAIAYHEGNPGHHMQIAIAQELTDTPTFRTQAFFTAYIEGWALYSETLAKEMGGYQNPYSDFGRLVAEMWRAVRLVVDTGLHAKGWSEQQAIDYFKEKTPVAEGAVVSEVRRYLVWPGQATAYKVGMLKIQALRHKAETALGDKFDIKAFHDTILGGGALPLEILERRVDLWIAKQQATN